MDKAATPNIDTGVGWYLALDKENQVARANVGTQYRLTPIIQHGYGSRWSKACPRLINVAYQPTAIEAGIGGIAPEAIGRTDKADGINGYVVRLPLRESRWPFECFTGSRTTVSRWLSAASCENERERHSPRGETENSEHVHAELLSADAHYLNSPLVSSTCQKTTQRATPAAPCTHVFSTAYR